MKHCRTHLYAYALSVLISSNAVTANAQSFCEGMEQIVVQAEGNFSNWTSIGQGGSIISRPFAADTCDLSQMHKGQQQYHCIWEYEYRSQNASDTFEHLVQSTQACLGDRATLSKSNQVNHPDSYDQHLFRLKSAGISVSIKDKAGIGKTYIFLRVQADPFE